MALTDAEKFKIVRLLGYPANTLTPESLSYSKIISDRLLSVPVLAETDIRALLTRIAALDTDLSAAIGSSGVKKIDDIEFFGQSEGTKSSELRKERRGVLKELASTLDMSFGPGLSSGSMGNVVV